MEITLKIPESLEKILDHQTTVNFAAFLQAVVNRYCVGAIRYGDPTKRKEYLYRLYGEIIVYAQRGNFEQLLNMAVYCFLESEAPQNPKFHFDNTVDSVTRKKD